MTYEQKVIERLERELRAWREMAMTGAAICILLTALIIIQGCVR